MPKIVRVEGSGNFRHENQAPKRVVQPTTVTTRPVLIKANSSAQALSRLSPAITVSRGAKRENPVNANSTPLTKQRRLDPCLRDVNELAKSASAIRVRKPNCSIIDNSAAIVLSDTEYDELPVKSNSVPSKDPLVVRKMIPKNPPTFKVVNLDKTTAKNIKLEQTNTNFSKRYCCQLCGLTFNDRKPFMAHINMPEDAPMLMTDYCESCKSMVEHNKTTQSHVCETDKKVDKQLYLCKKCKKVSKGREEFSCHFKLHCSERKAIYNCKICESTFEHPYHYEKHIKYFHNGSEKCQICGTVQPKIKQHRLTCEIAINTLSRGGFACLVCSSMFSDIKELQNHTGIANLEEKSAYFGCKKCLNIFTTKEFLANHIKKGHSTDIKCEIPGCIAQKIFQSKEHLNIHTFAFHKDKRIKCDKCPEEFLNGKTLLCHRIKRANCFTKTIYKCELCEDQKFMHPYIVLKHLLAQHDDLGKFNCNTCGLVFYPPVTPENHRETCMKLDVEEENETIPFFILNTTRKV